MSTLFVVLFLISFFFLAWGVISPASLSKQSKKPLTRKSAGISFGLISLVLFILVGVTAPKQASQQPTAAKAAAASTLKTDAQPAQPQPVVTTETVTETQPIAFDKTSVNDASRAAGSSTVTTAGVNGVQTLTYQVTKSDGVQTNKQLVKQQVTTPPVTEVTSMGTKVAKAPASKAVAAAPAAGTSSCDPNYSGACVPIASDVDCGGGSGNGPAYVYTRVKVIGSDIYHLDANGDGYGCDNL